MANGLGRWAVGSTGWSQESVEEFRAEYKKMTFPAVSRKDLKRAAQNV